MNLDLWSRRNCRLKVFHFWISGSPFVQRSVTICEIFEEGIKRINSVKLFRIRVSGSVGDPFKRFIIWSSGDLPLQWSETVYAILKEGIMGCIHVKLYEIRTSGSGGNVV